MSPNGPSRHFAATQQFGRFRSEADIERFSVCTEPVAFDPQRKTVNFLVARRLSGRRDIFAILKDNRDGPTADWHTDVRE